MKRVLFIALISLTLGSCSFEYYDVRSYSNLESKEGDAITSPDEDSKKFLNSNRNQFSEKKAMRD